MKVGVFMKNIDIQFVNKCVTAVKERLLFPNISNPNVRNSAFSEYCYKKIKREFKKILYREDYSISEKSNYVWICWFQGIEKAPDLVKCCYQSVKKYMNDKKIVLITEQNYKDYIELPDYIEKKFRKKLISYAHFSDLIRLELLTKYGGIWIDSTILLTGKPTLLYDDLPLFVYKNISLYRKKGLSVVASSWLIKAEKGEPITNLTKEILFQYWKKHNRLISYNLIHLAFTIATEVYSDEWNEVPSYSNIPPHILQFELLYRYNKKRFDQIKKMSNIHKLNHRIKTSDKNSNYWYILNMGDKTNEK